ncbi:MAG: bifunctional diaminohydroxyphosphoribosylaminopyrimidine deaminase/5-amino-6-(5-phosphoribosylamino)uracil reductase RibD [Acidimicrobiia bacterium]
MRAPDDEAMMARAVALAAGVRASAAPNPWVGCTVRTTDGALFDGATRPPGGPHAEVVALGAAAAGGADTNGATVWVTLEPCSHHGRTGPCADALVAAGVGRVVVAIEDPDARVAGTGIDRLRNAGVAVDVGVGADTVAHQLAPYLKHRRTGRPWVVLKLAASLDGRTAAPDGTSRWITGDAARADAHRLRAESDVIVVGAGTVRADDPELTVRSGTPPAVQPLRVVLGRAPENARARPCLEHDGPLDALLDELGRRGKVQVLVEGGPTVAGDFHRRGLVDRYVVYLAPALLGGDDGRPVLAGAGASTMADVWRGRVVAVAAVGGDLRIDVEPLAPATSVPEEE